MGRKRRRPKAKANPISLAPFSFWVSLGFTIWYHMEIKLTLIFAFSNLRFYEASNRGCFGNKNLGLLSYP